MCASTTKNLKSLFICQLFPNLSMNFIPLLSVILYSPETGTTVTENQKEYRVLGII